MFSSSLTTILLLLPLISAQVSYPIDPYPTDYVPDPLSYTLVPQPDPSLIYTLVPGPSYTEVPEPSLTYSETLPVITYPVCNPETEECPACNPETEECPPCTPGEGDCPYPVTSTTPLEPVYPTPSPSPTCVCFNYPCLPCNGTPIPYPQTIYTTEIHTITSCAPNTPCAPGQLTTSTISLSTIASPIAVYTTIYTTAYIDICPTGLTTKTYTITHTCTEEKCSVPTTLPEHFTTTEKVCVACPEKPTLTVTCPVETATGTWSNGTVPGAGTGKPVTPPAGSETAAGGNTEPTGTGNGCGYAGACPSGEGNGTGPYVTAGAGSVFVGGLKVLAIGGLVGVLVLML
ncbi:hypothetical protein VTL71DRAFT_15072 [Oculimacula yallundae]|uniref:Uncharacterized protein n=1 Tax=Oculimacula yallundae TaxID=86028 RepID=A0ABR4CHU3_9HELO